VAKPVAKWPLLALKRLALLQLTLEMVLPQQHFPPAVVVEEAAFVVLQLQQRVMESKAAVVVVEAQLKV
jgi:hypothetical protein